MSEIDISRMTEKQLRREVQNLRDELSIFKRKYEDTIYNLDSSNFGRSFTLEQNDMKAQIKVTADAIRTKVSNTEFESAFTQTADKISSIVSEFIDTSKATEVESSDEFEDTKTIYVIRERDEDGDVVSEVFYRYNDIMQRWDTITDKEMESSLFEQTPDGFRLRGDVAVDGSCIITDTLQFNSEDRPVNVQYSVDGQTDWHDVFDEDSDKFMRLKIGADWTNAIKIVAVDGVDGQDGKQGIPGVVDYERVHTILENNYKIKRTVIDDTSVVTATLHSAELYTPNIYGENLTLATKFSDKTNVYNNLYLTPTSMYLVNAYEGTANTKFYVDLGQDVNNSTIRMRLGAGVDNDGYGQQALFLEKYGDEIRIGTYVDLDESGALSNFAGMMIKPSTGAVTFTGTVQAVAVFG